MTGSNLIFGDLQESIQNINVTIPLPDYLRHCPIFIEISKRNLKFKRLFDGKLSGEQSEIDFDEDFKMPREILLRPETCTIRLVGTCCKTSSALAVVFGYWIGTNYMLEHKS